MIILENKSKLFVGNLPYTITQDQLAQLFTEFGEVAEAVIITDRASGRSKGFGFVTFANEEDAAKAVAELDGKEMEGRNMVVNVARPPRERE